MDNLVVTITQGQMTIEGAPEIEGDDGRLSFAFAMMWAMTQILEQTVAQMERETVH